MPEYKTTYTKQDGKVVKGYKGSQAGQSFRSPAEASEDKDWQQYKVEKNLSFAASKTQHEAAFKEWRKKKAAKAGQAAAVAGAQ